MDETVVEPIAIDPLVTLGEHVAASLGDAVLGFEVAYGDLIVTVARDSIVNVATFLRDDGRQ